VPKIVNLPEVLNASDRVARGDTIDLADLSAIRILLDAGTGTLGGARPKASVVGDDGVLQIAKFPHPDDDWEVMAWEKTALDLAERAGIEVPRRTIAHINGRAVLLLDRFDRSGGQRVGYMSAMTLVQGRDGGGSGARDYLELAAELADVSAATDADLSALWRRIAFSVAIHNTDDHFRNHGFLRQGSGWRLSPVFDVNPNPVPRLASVDVSARSVYGLPRGNGAVVPQPGTDPMPLPPLRVATPQVAHVDLDDLQMDVARSRAGSYDAARDRILVRACLLELTETDRKVLELCLFHGWSVEEIGRYLGEPEVEIAVRISDHVQRLENRHGMIAAPVVACATQPEPAQWPSVRSVRSA
jgi:HipA-like C-terminal domain/Sigma-70, region 4